MQPQPDDVLASRVFAMLSNGMGGIDWAGLPAAMEFYGIEDAEMLLHRLIVFKTYRKPT